MNPDNLRKEWGGDPLVEIARHLGRLSGDVEAIRERLEIVEDLEPRITALERTTLSMQQHAWVSRGLHSTERREATTDHLVKTALGYVALVLVTTTAAAIGLSQIAAHLIGH